MSRVMSGAASLLPPTTSSTVVSTYDSSKHVGAEVPSLGAWFRAAVSTSLIVPITGSSISSGTLIVVEMFLFVRWGTGTSVTSVGAWSTR